MVTPSAAAALDDGAAIDDDGAIELLELPDEAVSLLLHAVSERAATAATPIPATRSLVTKITPTISLGLLLDRYSDLPVNRMGAHRVIQLTAR
ncbi:hypothetical protein [Amycolatopsis sp. SID8362]|uniref:hypothetical protein n=1 Tax=Amycolatopsis sp. SID8362 TaxID=2690346 RepID=UPI002814DE26|nr:hypothetical protein [Amycolatopsis sp. SID8362]